MDARPADPGKVEVEAFGERRDEGRGPKLDLRIERVHLAERCVPKGIVIGRARIDALVDLQFVQRLVD
jgi:hypothetical protein